MELQKEKLFEDDSVSRAKAWSENDFSFKYVICAQHCNGLFTVHHSLFTHLDANIMFAPVLDLLHAHGGGKTDWARAKVCHPELVSGSELSAKHTSPYRCLGFAPRSQGEGQSLSS